MARTYTQIQKQIEALHKQAEKLKSSEISGVVERIKTAIAHYDLTPEQLFGASSVSTRKASSLSAQATDKNGRAEGASAFAYADGAGNVWGGRGPRPRWLREALAAGKSLQDFSTEKRLTETAKGAAKKHAAKVKRKATAYSDGTGNMWSGFGPKPRWLKDAIAAGGTLEQYSVGALTQG